MRDFAKISPQYWISDMGRQIKQYGVPTQLVGLYLLSNPHANMLGIYYLPISFIAHETGLPFEGASEALQRLCEVGFCAYDHALEYVWVCEMAAYQIGTSLKVSDNRVKYVQEIFPRLPNIMFLWEFYDKYQSDFYLEPPSFPRTFEGPSKPLRSKEKKKEKKKEKEQGKEKETYSAELPSSSTPAAKISPNSESSLVITMPLNDHTEFIITPAHIAEWQALYPAVDVLQTLRHIRGWNLSNPKKRKTKNGILKHITQWLAKEQDKVKGKVQVGNSLWDHNVTVASQWLDKTDNQIIDIEAVHEFH